MARSQPNQCTVTNLSSCGDSYRLTGMKAMTGKENAYNTSSCRDDLMSARHGNNETDIRDPSSSFRGTTCSLTTTIKFHSPFTKTSWTIEHIVNPLVLPSLVCRNLGRPQDVRPIFRPCIYISIHISADIFIGAGPS